MRQVAGAFYRRRSPPGVVEGAPYRAGDLIASRYEIKEVTGAGPLGFVFRCRDKELDVEVAVKLINPRLLQTDEEREHLFKVIRLGRRLSHQNLARMTEDGDDNGWPFYSTAFLDGLSLRKIIDLRLAKGQVFTLREAEPILGQIANALTSALKQGPHANLKPENVIVLPDLLKVTDFGLGAALPRAAFIQAQRARKAERYYAPEFLDGARPDARSDVYSLGVILGELLTGLTPEDGIPDITQHRPELPRAVQDVYRRALDPDPQARFASPADLFQEMSRAAKQAPAMELTPRESLLPPPVPASLQVKADVSSPLHRGADEKTVPNGAAPRKFEPPPLDATQPLDAALLMKLMGAIPTDSTQPVDLSSLPALPSHATQPMGVRPSVPLLDSPPTKPDSPHSQAPGATQPIQNFLSQLPRPPKGAPPDATMPLDPSLLPLSTLNPDNASTQALQASALPPPSQPAPSFAAPLRRNNATLWLVLLTVGGLITGTLGGYMVLDSLRHRSRGPVSPRPTSPRSATPTSSGGGAAGGHAKDDPKDSPGSGARDARKSPDIQVAAGSKAGRSCPAGMKLVPQGAFKMGTAKDDPMMGFDERALGAVEVPAFCVDEYEYPNQAGAMPLVNVSWPTAKSLCEAKGKRLCSEQEWEKACKGPQSARFPYGNAFDASACNTEDSAGEDREIAAAGRFSRCRSAYGVADLSGNVAEWTSTVYAGNVDRTQKGGSFDRPDYAARCSARRNGAPSGKSAEVGFRCCANVP